MVCLNGITKTFLHMYQNHKHKIISIMNVNQHIVVSKMKITFLHLQCNLIGGHENQHKQSPYHIYFHKNGKLNHICVSQPLISIVWLNVTPPPPPPLFYIKLVCIWLNGLHFILKHSSMISNMISKIPQARGSTQDNGHM